jgi:hypothetical protein
MKQLTIIYFLKNALLKKPESIGITFHEVDKLINETVNIEYFELS